VSSRTVRAIQRKPILKKTKKKKKKKRVPTRSHELLNLEVQKRVDKGSKEWDEVERWG
jgi:hypothetical protein